MASRPETWESIPKCLRFCATTAGLPCLPPRLVLRSKTAGGKGPSELVFYQTMLVSQEKSNFFEKIVYFARSLYFIDLPCWLAPRFTRPMCGGPASGCFLISAARRKEKGRNCFSRETRNTPHTFLRKVAVGGYAVLKRLTRQGRVCREIRFQLSFNPRSIAAGAVLCCAGLKIFYGRTTLIPLGTEDSSQNSVVIFFLSAINKSTSSAIALLHIHLSCLNSSFSFEFKRVLPPWTILDLTS